jgi:hypothetical protein
VLLGLLVVDANALALQLVEILDPLRDGEPLFGAPSPHLDTRLLLGFQCRHDGLTELVQQVLRRRRFNCIPEPRHLTQTTDTRAHTKGALTSELNRDEAERLVTGWDQRELGTAEDVRRESGKLGLAVDALGVLLHELLQFQGGKLAV